MNFHKTIGYLAALLLIVGFGVPDSFAQGTISLLIPAAQRTLLESTTTANDVVVTATVSGVAAEDAIRTVNVSLASSNSDDTNNSNLPSGNISVEIAANATSGFAATTVSVTPIADADAINDVVTITGTGQIDIDGAATDLTDGTITLTIVDTQADLTGTAAIDASGFRVTIAAPSPTGWAKVAKNAVKVQVHRRAGVASDWGNYASIQVALHDESDYDDDAKAHGDALYSLTVADDTGNQNQLGSLVLERMKTDSLTANSTSLPGGGVTNNVDATTNIVAYQRRTRTGRYDMLEFRFNIPETNAEPETANNNLLKVYAVATFTVGNAAVGTIDSRDTETTIYPSNPSTFPDKVGDGKLIRIDRDKPRTNIINSMSVAFTDNNKNTMGAGIGDEIELTATIDGAFRDHSVVFQIIAPEAVTVDHDADSNTDEVPVIAANGALVGFGKTFTAAEVFSAGGTLSHEFKVTANQFKRKYTANDPIGDPRKYDKNDLREDDGLMVRARVQVKDQAANASNQYVATNAALTAADDATDGISDAFMLDSKPPKITVLYPKPSAADSNRFTAEINQGYEFLGEGGQDVGLNPLKFKVDEDVSSSYVVIDGSHAARNDTLDLSGVVEGENIIAVSDGTHTHRSYTRTDNGKPDNGKASDDTAYNKGTKTAKLTVAAYDMSGNQGKGTPDGGDPIFDNKGAVISKLFPNGADLEDYDDKIGGPEGTQHPVFRLNEAVDSINVRYEGGGTILSVVGSDADNNTVGNNIRIKFLGDNALQDGEIYDLQVYVRDLAGHVTLSDDDSETAGAQPVTGLTFDNDLANPSGGAFKISTHVRTFNTADQFGMDKGHVKMDSVVANQGMRLDITALDAALSESAGEDRVAITYARAGVKVVVMDSDGNPVSQAKFWGGASGTGTATLNDLGWSGGKRSIFFQVTKAGSYTVAVKDMNTDGTVNFMKTTDIVVDAADFQKFVITAWDDGKEVSTIWEEFDLLVTPTDQWGNASLKTFNDFAGTGKVAPVAAQDSLDILDTRVGKGAPAPENAANTTKKYSHVDVDFNAALIEDMPFAWSVKVAGESFSVRTQENRTRGTARVRATVDNDYILESDARSRNRSGDVTFTISASPTPVLTLWGPNGEDWTDVEEIEIPADPGDITVTVAAEDFNAGDMVTFTKNGTAMDPVAANDDGVAKLDITMSAAGTVTVSASSDQASTGELVIVFVEAPVVTPTRTAHVNAEGEPVYLISDTDMTVGVDDFLAFVAAYGSSEGDENYNLQADVDDDGDVDLQDYLEFISSYGSTAVGPSTKPLVLLPGINENAEFLLSLGSERVIAGELVAVDVSLANVEALMGYGFALNYETDKFEFVSVAPADEDLLKSTGGETLFHHIVADGQVTVANGVYNGTAISGGGDVVRFVFRVLYEFEDNARFEIADGLVFDPSQLQNPALVAGVLELQSTPREFALHQNFPNPFNPDTTIKYDLAESADITLQIYNVLGQVVRTLVVSEAQNAGRYQIRWNGMDDRGVPVSSGVYFYRISADGKFQNVRKLMLLK